MGYPKKLANLGFPYKVALYDMVLMLLSQFFVIRRGYTLEKRRIYIDDIVGHDLV